MTPKWMLATVLATVLAPLSHASADGWIPLWNGKDLAEWSIWLNKPHPSVEVPGLERDAEGRYTRPVGHGQDPLRTFSVVPDIDGQPAIRITGEIFGELRSKASLQNYHLSLQFKWGETKWPPRHEPATPRDSGLLYHVHSESGVDGRNWSRSVELQIQERDCGDLYAVGSAIAVRADYDKSLKFPEYRYNPEGTWTFFSQIPGQTGRCIKSPDAEHPTGQWNTIELICLGDQAIHIVNGKVVMRLQQAMRIDTALPQPLTAGPIILQSEGAEVFFRDIRYRPILEIPAEFR